MLYQSLQHSKDEQLAAIAVKALKEVDYHLKWSKEWVIRLGDGTEESHQRMQKAVNELWSYTGELFIANDTDKIILQSGVGVDISSLKQQWMDYAGNVFAEAGIVMPKTSWMQQGGKEGRHSEHLGYVLAELQFMQRAYPGMEW